MTKPSTTPMVFIWCLMTIVANAEPAKSQRGMVATVHPLATDAAVDAMREGGNAVDAAVAAALMLGVVDNYNSGIGGGCFILIRLADGRLVAVDGRETAPAKATRDMYVRDGKPQTQLSKIGPLASGVPGALAAYAHVVKHHGQRKLADLLLPAAAAAENGFRVDRNYAGRLAAMAKRLAEFEGTRAVLLKDDGSPFDEGEWLRQTDLARTYQAIAEHGIEWFYRGPFARDVGAWMAEQGGILSSEDFARYEVKLREPVLTRYRGYSIAGFPPPSSGGVHVAQILNILERFDVQSLQEENPAAFVHVLSEAMKLAFADRVHWLGDPDFANVPRGLVDEEYAARLAARIDLEKAGEVSGPGSPPRSDEDLFGKHTTHIAAADADGNWVAITTTINTSFGSNVIVPGTGVLLNNEMDDFSIQPGVPNAFGLIGAEANAIAPGKRPLSSMSPTIVLKDGRPVLTCGAAGGPKIITQTLLTIVNHLDLGMSLPDAVAAPRFHHQWSPGELLVERGMPAALIEALEKRGHTVRRAQSMGITQAIARDAGGKTFIGVHDPRIDGKAAGP